MNIRDKRLIRKLIGKQTIESLAEFTSGERVLLADLYNAFEVDLAKARLEEKMAD